MSVDGEGVDYELLPILDDFKKEFLP